MSTTIPNFAESEVIDANAEAKRAAAANDANRATNLLKDKVAASGIDPDVLQLIMQVAMASAAGAADAMRKPTQAEQVKIDAEIERLKRQRIQAAKIGESIREVELAEQARCGHVKPNGEHTFRGQVHSNGTCMVQCQRCHVMFDDLAATPDIMQSGLNLDQVKGLTIAHLKQWQRNSPKIRHYYQEEAKKVPVNPTAERFPFGEGAENEVEG